MPKGVFPKGLWFWVGAVLVAAMLPFATGSDYFLNICILFGLYAAINVMWMLLLGTAGIFSFATVAIVGASAYVAVYLSVARGWSWPLMFVAATVAGLVFGLLVAVPAIRLRGVYFALLTFGIVELARSFVLVNKDLGKATGLFGADSFVPGRLIGTEEAALIGYFAAFALLALALLVYWLVDGGRLGLLLRTARESEPVAHALGIDIVRARLAVVAISSAMLGLIGGFYAAFYRGVSPPIFGFDLLLLLFAMIVIGGIGSARGVLLGTALLLFVDEQFVEAGAKRLIALGILMLLITLFSTRGLAGIPAQLREWVKAGGAPEEEGPTVSAASEGAVGRTGGAARNKALMESAAPNSLEQPRHTPRRPRSSS